MMKRSKENRFKRSIYRSGFQDLSKSKRLKSTSRLRKRSQKNKSSRLSCLYCTKNLKIFASQNHYKKENILHVSFDDDKVKGKVLFLVNENIAKTTQLTKETDLCQNNYQNYKLKIQMKQ